MTFNGGVMATKTLLLQKFLLSLGNYGIQLKLELKYNILL